MPSPQIDVDSLVAIDMHTHAEVDSHGQVALSAREDDKHLAVRKLEKTDKLSPSPLTEPDDDEDTEEDSE